MSEIVILPQFRDLIPPLAPSEREQLEANIVEHGGARDPIVVWAQDAFNCVLLDGHNRYEICTRLGLHYTTVEMDFDTEEDAADWIDANQLGKRNLTPEGFQLALGRRYQRAKKKQGAPDGNTNRSFQSGQNDHFEKPSKTAEKIAKEHGVSEKTVRRAGKLVEEIEADPDLKEAVTKGKTVKQAKAEKAAKQQAEAPHAPAPEPEKTAKDGMGKHVGQEVSALFMAADADFRDVNKAIVALSHMFDDLKAVAHGERLEHQQLDTLIAELKKFVKFGRPYTECFKCQRKLNKGCNLCHGSGWLTRNEHGRSRTNGGEAWLESR